MNALLQGFLTFFQAVVPSIVQEIEHANDTNPELLKRARGLAREFVTLLDGADERLAQRKAAAESELLAAADAAGREP